MRYILHSLMLMMSMLILTSCAATHLDSYMEPSYRGQNFKLTSVIIDTESFKLPERKILETEFAKKFSEKGIKAYRALDSWSATEYYSTEKKYQSAKRSNIKAILNIDLKQRNFERVWDPDRFKMVKRFKNFEIDITLTDPNTGKRIWSASGKTGEFLGFTPLYSDIAESLVERTLHIMKEDGLIQ